MGDDRDFFEEDFVNMLPGSWMTLPPGFDVTVSRVSNANALAIKAEDISSSYFGFVPRQQIDSDATKGTIAALQERGIAVTIVDGKTDIQMDAIAYRRASRKIDWGSRYPYDGPEDAAPAADWAHAAARGILDELRDVPGIKHYLDDIEVATRVEIVQGLADVVRAAFIRRSS
ncbi:hypothetical protein ACTJK5_09620 [Agrobacterium sp. 22094]|uniref:hypothetical protein n=1 Tax=Agrobacterium sp. 22094 TaxID=3453872 RepID=UPI003F873EF8